MSDQESILAALRNSADDLAREVERLPADDALWRPAETEWSQHQCLTHLQICERNIFLPRIQAMAAQDNPFLPVVDEAGIMKREWNPERPRAELLTDFLDARREELALLEQHDWGRPGRHEVRGPISMAWAAHYTLAHTWEHLSQMTRVRLAYATHGRTV